MPAKSRSRYKAYSTTTVGVEKSRRQITELLRQWNANRISWTDDFDAGAFVLEFIWTWEEHCYRARVTVILAEKSDGKTDHRVLLNYLKACFTAVEAGLMEPAQVFLPMLVADDGRTVAETMIPKLHTMTALQIGSGT